MLVTLVSPLSTSLIGFNVCQKEIRWGIPACSFSHLVWPTASPSFTPLYSVYMQSKSNRLWRFSRIILPLQLKVFWVRANTVTHGQLRAIRSRRHVIFVSQKSNPCWVHCFQRYLPNELMENERTSNAACSNWWLWEAVPRWRWCWCDWPSLVVDVTTATQLWVLWLYVETKGVG